MIRSLTGKLRQKMDQAVLIEVQGIGYLVYVPKTPTVTNDTELTLHTYLAVRETALDLYGFETLDELELFEHLLTLPKIGPKSALQVLTQASVELIKSSIANNDPGQLSKMSGIGKKTAEKVIAGLTEIYEKQGLVFTTEAATAGSGAHLSDTIDALVALGYPEHDARKSVQQITESKPELKNTNDILKEALRTLGQ